jgi:dipeptidyl aminopeptidase/acylaminoacyl peptidase
MRFRLWSLLAVLFFCAPVMAAAIPPPTLGVDAYGRLPNIEQMQMSPSGEKIAYVAVDGDHRRLTVKSLAGDTIFSVAAGDLKVRSVYWAGEDHIVLTLSMTQGLLGRLSEFSHSLVINLINRKTFIVFNTDPTIFNATFGYDGAVARNGHWFGFFGGLTMQKTRGFEPTFTRTNLIDLYQVDLDSGESLILAPGREYPHTWAVDADGKVIAHSEYDPRSAEWTLQAGAEGGPILGKLKSVFDGAAIVGLGRTTGTVVVNEDDPEEWSLTDGRRAVLAPGKVIGGYIFDPTSRRLVGVDLSGDSDQQQFFDQALKARQAAFQRALGDKVRLLSWSADLRRLVLFTEGDSDAGTYWVADGQRVKVFGYRYPEIPDANVASTSIVTYKAADGLEIHGVLTLPPGRDPHRLPLVVLPHGGPEAHDSLGFDWWAQAFANQGYAVFQPNFRGSDGYGIAFRDAGFGEWGRRMQTDLSDGVAELSRQGIIDPRRACIVGASYGGYAALAGVTVQQGTYRCAVSYGGLSDLSYLLDHEFPESSTDNGGGRYMLSFLGVKSSSDRRLDAISPVKLAAKADAPILIIHGVDDTVVPIGQSREMYAALKRAGKSVEMVELKGEDHWLSSGVSRRAMLSATLAFVERTNPSDRP